MDDKERNDNDKDFNRMVRNAKLFADNENNVSFRILINNLVEFATRIKQDRDALLLKLKETQQKEYDDFCRTFGEEFFTTQEDDNYSGEIKDMCDDELLSHYFWSGNQEKEDYEKIKKEVEKRGIVPKGMG